MAQQPSTEELNGAMSFLIKFGKQVEEVAGEIDQAVNHLQSLEQELGGEGETVMNFVNEELLPVAKEYKQTGNLDHEEVVKLIQDEDSLERTVEKVNGDLEKEVNEIKKIGSEFGKLERMAEEAEKAIEKIERFEKAVD